MCVSLTVHKHIIQYIYISKSELRFNKRTNEKTFSINLNATHQSLRTCLVTVFIFYFRFLVFKGKRKKKNKFFLFSKWKTCLVSCFEKHIFLKQNSGNLFGSCFWKSWILFSLVNFFLKIIFIQFLSYIVLYYYLWFYKDIYATNSWIPVYMYQKEKF